MSGAGVEGTAHYAAQSGEASARETESLRLNKLWQKEHTGEKGEQKPGQERRN